MTSTLTTHVAVAPVAQPKHDTIVLGNLLSIADQIQAFSIARKTGEIRVLNVPSPAYIALVDGEVVHAQYGPLEGVQAAVALVQLGDPPTEFVIGRKSSHRTIRVPYIQLLFEAARLRDETPANESTQPLDALDAPLPTLQIRIAHSTLRHRLPPGLTTIGRSATCDIALPDPSVSKHHATIEHTAVGLVLKDLLSTNGTYVDGDRIKKRWLTNHCIIHFGTVAAQFLPGRLASHG